MGTGRTVTVFGVYGHTGRFVVADLPERGFVPVPAGRDPDQPRVPVTSNPGLDARRVSVGDPASWIRVVGEE